MQDGDLQQQNIANLHSLWGDLAPQKLKYANVWPHITEDASNAGIT